MIAIRDLAILAAQVTNLARAGLAAIANGNLATLVGVKVGASARAVAVSRNWLLVDVVHEGTARLREIVDMDSPLNARSARKRAGRDRASKTGLVSAEMGGVASTREVVLDDRSKIGLRGGDRSRGDE